MFVFSTQLVGLDVKGKMSHFFDSQFCRIFFATEVLIHQVGFLILYTNICKLIQSSYMRKSHLPNIYDTKCVKGDNHNISYNNESCIINLLFFFLDIAFQLTSAICLQKLISKCKCLIISIFIYTIDQPLLFVLFVP